MIDWLSPNPFEENTLPPVTLEVTYDTTQRWAPDQPLYGRAVVWGPREPKSLREAVLRAAGAKRQTFERVKGRLHTMRFRYRTHRSASQARKKLDRIRAMGYHVVARSIVKRAA